MGCEGGWFHGRGFLVDVALHDCSNEKGSRLSMMNSILVSRFVKKSAKSSISLDSVSSTFGQHLWE